MIKIGLLSFVIALSPALVIADVQTPINASSAVLNRESKPLPSPLTLSDALNLPLEHHPDIAIAQQNVLIREAKIQQIESQFGVRASLSAEAKLIQAAHMVTATTEEDHRLSIHLNKQLYDFGKNAAAKNAANHQKDAAQLLLSQHIDQQKINIMAAFFNVLLADLKYIRDNEAMSVAFIRMDRTSDREKLGMRSELEVLQASVNYQNIRYQYYASRSLQRSTRAIFADAINRPGELSAEIAEPKLSLIKRKIPDIDSLLVKGIRNNRELNALRFQLQAAISRINEAKAQFGPSVEAGAQVSEYSRETPSHNEWEIHLSLNVPLLSGGRVSADVSLLQAQYYRLQASLKKTERQVKQRILETWQLLDTLRIKREEMIALSDYRDLVLDRSRTLYELEAKADLGDSMVKTSDARYQSAKVRYETALAWAKLELLLGELTLVDDKEAIH